MVFPCILAYGFLILLVLLLFANQSPVTTGPLLHMVLQFMQVIVQFLLLPVQMLRQLPDLHTATTDLSQDLVFFQGRIVERERAKGVSIIYLLSAPLLLLDVGDDATVAGGAAAIVIYVPDVIPGVRKEIVQLHVCNIVIIVAAVTRYVIIRLHIVIVSISSGIIEIKGVLSAIL